MNHGALTAELNLYLIFSWFIVSSGVNVQWVYDKVKHVKKKVIADGKYLSSNRFFLSKLIRVNFIQLLTNILVYEKLRLRVSQLEHHH